MIAKCIVAIVAAAIALAPLQAVAVPYAQMAPALSALHPVASPGPQLPAQGVFASSIASDGSRYLVMSNGVGGVPLVARFLDVEGVEVERVTIPAPTGSDAVVAWDGARFLVAWTAWAGGDAFDVRGVRLAADGTLLDPAPFEIAAGPGSQRAIDVAAGGGTFAVTVAVPSTLAVVRVGGDGVAMDPAPISIAGNAPGYRGGGAVAWTGDRFAIAWREIPTETGQNAIYVTGLTPGGTLLPDVVVQAPTHVDLEDPDIAAIDGSALVVWQGDRYEPTLFARMVDAAGAVTELSIGTGFPYTDREPVVAVVGSSYLVASRAKRLYQDEKLVTRIVGADATVGAATMTALWPEPTFKHIASVGARARMVYRPIDNVGRSVGIDALGAVEADPVPLTMTAPSHVSPALAYGAGAYLSAWVDARGGVWAARMDRDGVALDGSGFRVSADTGAASVSVAFDGEVFLVAWRQDTYGPMTTTVRAARVAQDGTVHDPSGIVVAAVTPGWGDVGVAAGPSGFLVASTPGPTVALVRSDGTHTVAQTIGTGTQSGVAPAVASNGSGFLVAWENPNAGSAVQSRRLDAEGAPSDDARTVAQGSGPAIASDGNGYALAWETRDDGHGDIAMQRLDGAGTPADPAPIAVAAQSPGEVSASVAFNGTGYVVSWIDAGAPYQRRVLATRIGADGAPLDAPPREIGIVGVFGRTGLAAGMRSRVAAWVTVFDEANQATLVKARFLDAPDNDDFVDARPIVGAAGALEQTNCGTGPEPHEPRHRPTHGQTAWYSWTPPISGNATLVARSAVLTPAVGVYVGSALGELSTHAWSPAGTVAVAMFAGQPYRISVDGGEEACGAFDLEWSIVTDTTPPETTIVEAPPTDSNDPNAYLHVEASEPATFACTLDDEVFEECPMSFEGLRDGAHTFRVRAIDRFGNEDPTPAEHRWTIDTAAPSVTITQSPPWFGQSADVTVGFTTEGADDVECRLNVQLLSSCSSPLSMTLEEGWYQLEIAALDAAGNRSAAMVNWSVDLHDPSVTLLRPTRGVFVDGSEVSAGIAGVPPVIVGPIEMRFEAFDMFAEGYRAMISLTAEVDGVAYALEHPNFTEHAFTFGDRGEMAGRHTLVIKAVDQSERTTVVSQDFFFIPK